MGRQGSIGWWTGLLVAYRCLVDPRAASARAELAHTTRARARRRSPSLVCPSWQGKGNSGVKALVESKGLVQISDAGELESIVAAVLDANPGQLAQYRGGKTKLLGFFVGQVMKESKGRANPAELNRILQEKLNG